MVPMKDANPLERENTRVLLAISERMYEVLPTLFSWHDIAELNEPYLS